MKRAIIIILGLTAACWGGNLPAQQPVSAPAAPPPATKVGVINMVQLYSKCTRVKDLKDRIEKEVLPFKTEKEKLEKLGVQWQTALNNPNSGLKQEEREQGFQVLKECKRRLEDLNYRFEKDVAPRLKTDMANLTEYIDKSAKHYSAQQGFHLVIWYGEPESPLTPLLSFRHTVQAIDAGYVMPLYFPAVDITPDVLKMLNAR